MSTQSKGNNNLFNLFFKLYALEIFGFNFFLPILLSLSGERFHFKIFTDPYIL